MAPTTLPLNSEFVILGTKELQEARPPPDNVHTLPELFARTARQHPQRPALSCSSSGTLHTLSYSNLAGKVHQISDTLREKLGEMLTVTTSDIVPPVVGIWLERSADL